MKVPIVDHMHYSWMPIDHYLVDDDGNIVGVFPKPKEIPLSEQKFTKINNITWYGNKSIKEEWMV